jgi:DNA topoisomerase-3
VRCRAAHHRQTEGRHHRRRSSLAGRAVSNGPAAYPPAPATKRFADALARQKGIGPPSGYKTSISICSAFLKEHVPKKAEGEASEKLDSKPVSPAQLLYAKKIAQGKGVVIPEEAKANKDVVAAASHPASSAPAQPNSVTDTPLRIPYGNKEVALKLGARYRSGGWYAPPGVDLSAFGERGWL